jgi:choline dehydrogenase-like flavoprotein
MNIEKECDFIIVGTGPGGATIAKQLAAIKKRVLTVEYGPKLDVTGFMKIGLSYIEIIATILFALRKVSGR